MICIYRQWGFGQRVSEMVLLGKVRGVMVCAPRLIGLKRWHSITLNQQSAGVCGVNSPIVSWSGLQLGAMCSFFLFLIFSQHGFD